MTRVLTYKGFYTDMQRGDVVFLEGRDRIFAQNLQKSARNHYKGRRVIIATVVEGGVELIRAI